MSEESKLTEKPKRRWYQFHLWHLFVPVTVVAIVSAFWASWWIWFPGPQVKYRRAAAPIEELGGYVEGYPDFGVEGLTGICFFDVAVPLTDADLEPLSGYLETLPNLKTLSLYDMQVTDAGLEHLKGLTKLEYLTLWYTQVSDAGLVHLQGLTKLKGLNLCGTQVTDDGLEQLTGLTNLEYLSLDGTQIRDEGVKELRQALPNCEIYHTGYARGEHKASPTIWICPMHPEIKLPRPGGCPIDAMDLIPWKEEWDAGE